MADATEQARIVFRQNRRDYPIRCKNKSCGSFNVVPVGASLRPMVHVPQTNLSVKCEDCGQTSKYSWNASVDIYLVK